MSPWWSFMILVCSSYGSEVFAWAQKAFCCHLPKERFKWAPLSHDSWTCTFLILQGLWCPRSLSEVLPHVLLTGYCIAKPEVIIKLKQGEELWPLERILRLEWSRWVNHCQVGKKKPLEMWSRQVGSEAGTFDLCVSNTLLGPQTFESNWMASQPASGNPNCTSFHHS